jgi:AcrR family transcriptional regulator
MASNPKPERPRSPTQSRPPKATGRSRTPKDPRSLPENRRQILVNEAARLFGGKGYENTSMRDIAAVVGILPGSLYHHFRSKEDLFVAVYSYGVSHILQAVNDAVAKRADPWARLEAACVAHMQSLLVKDSFAAVMISHFSINSLPKHDELVALRDSYEIVFKDLIAALPLPAGIDRRIFRLGLLGSMNWAIAWYDPSGETPANIARKLLKTIRRDDHK